MGSGIQDRAGTDEGEEMNVAKKWWALIRVSMATMWSSVVMLFSPDRKLPLADSIKFIVHFNALLLRLLWVIGTSDEYLRNLARMADLLSSNPDAGRWARKLEGNGA